MVKGKIIKSELKDGTLHLCIWTGKELISCYKKPGRYDPRHVGMFVEVELDGQEIKKITPVISSYK